MGWLGPSCDWRLAADPACPPTCCYAHVQGSLSVISDSLATMEVLEEVNLEGDVRISGPLSTDGEDGVCALAQVR